MLAFIRNCKKLVPALSLFTQVFSLRTIAMKGMHVLVHVHVY